ncbi:hypothetical protein LAZ67_2003692, partial [Cordylochernes scorpioides]
MTTERLPTRLEIPIKGEAWPAYLSSGIKCSRCHGQGHRRANCPLLAGRTNAPRPATPISPTSVPPMTAPGLPRQPSAHPPPPASPSPAMETPSASPAARAVTPSAAPRPSTPVAPAVPVEMAPPAPPPVTPAPSLRAPGGSVSPQSTKSGPPAQDIEMTAIEESSASSTSSSRTSMRDDLVAFIQRSPTVSFTGTDALGLGREEVLDLLSSRTKAQRKRGLLTPPQTDALAGLIEQILGLKPAGNTNVNKILHQVKSELKKGPAAVPPTPSLPALQHAGPTPPVPHGVETKPAMATPPPPLPTPMEEELVDHVDLMEDLFEELNSDTELKPLLDSGYSSYDLSKTINQMHANPPSGDWNANLAAARGGVTTGSAAATSSNGAARVLGNWADYTEDQGPGEDDDFTVVKNKKRRRVSPGSPAAAAPSSGTRGAGATRRPRSSTGWAPRVEEVRTTRAHIAEARARQASSTEDHCVFVERNPELEPYHYMRAIDRMFGSTREVFQVTKMNGHFLVGLANRGMAERLVNEGLEVEGTLHRAFPFRKRAERITVGNLPFFVGDAAVISALSSFGRVTSIAPKLMKAGPYVYNDGRREAFIILREGITIERLPTRLDISIKGEAWPAYLSSGIRCSRCRGQGHRRANCPLLAGRTNAPGPATPTSPTSVPSATAPGLPQQPSAQPPPSASPSPTLELSDVPPASRAALLPPAAPRPPPPAPLALPVEDTSPAPPPVIPAPSLRAPGGSVNPQSSKSEPSARDIEMTAIEASSASYTSSSRTSMRDDLVAFIQRSPTVSFTGTDALGLGREEVLDLLSSRTKAQRKRGLLTPPQTDALAGLIEQILGLKPAGNTNVYKILHQVKSELKKGPVAVPPTPSLPALQHAGPTPPVPHGVETKPAMATPPPPLPTPMEEEHVDHVDLMEDLFEELNSDTELKPLLDSGRAPPFFHPGGCMNVGATSSLVWADSPFDADQLPVRHGLISQIDAEISAKNQLQIENSIEMQESASNANLPTGERYAKSAASHEFAATMPSSGALPSRQNWAEISEDQGPDSGDDYTVVQNKRRRRDTAAPRVTTAQSNSAGPAARRQRSSPAFIPRAQEIRTTRTHIAEARARQATCTEEQCFFLEYCPSYEPYHYLKAIGGIVGGTKNIAQFSKVNGQYLVGLTSRSMAERLIREGLEVEGTLLRTFPFRRSATRITIGNLPFFVRDAIVIDALARFGRVTSIAPKQLKVGEFEFTDGRREAFILLHDGITVEKLPTRFEIKIKGEAWPAYITYGIKCSRCHGQGHRRASCPLLYGQSTTSRRASPPSTTGFPPSTAPGLPRQSSAAPPAPAPPSPSNRASGAPSDSCAAPLPSAVPGLSTPAPPASPTQAVTPAPPPMTPSPVDPMGPRSAASRPELTPPAQPDFVTPPCLLPTQETIGPASSTTDVEMTPADKNTASSGSSKRKNTRDDLVVYLKINPSVSFARTDALGLGREEVLDLLSSKTKAQRQGPLLSPLQSNALSGLIDNILDLKPGGQSNLYKILRQVKAELRTSLAAVSKTDEDRKKWLLDTFKDLNHRTVLRPILEWTNEESIINAVLLPDDAWNRFHNIPRKQRNILADFLDTVIGRARGGDQIKSLSTDCDWNANLAAARGDVTTGSAAATSSNGAARVLGNWADYTEDQGPGEDDDFTVVRNKRRRRDSPGSPAAAAPSSGTRGAGVTRRPRSSTGWAPRAEEVRTTRAHIAEARARQASSTENHCVFVERSPELEPYHYLRAIDRMFGSTREVFQVTKMNGHFLVGLANRGMAERLVNEGLEVEGTLHKAFPFRKRAERITVGNLPFFVGDAAVISALSSFGRVTSIAPKLMKAGPYVYNDGRREAFIILREGMTIERLPTRLDISIKGEAWPAYLSSGIRCSRCRGQGHRRANCPLLAERTNAPGPATPTSPTSVPSATAPGLPQQPSAQPPPSASPSPTLELSDVPPASRAALLPPAAPRPPPPAPLALPVEDTSPAPPPAIPAPFLRAPGGSVNPQSSKSEPSARDIEMTAIEESSASSTSSSRTSMRDDLVAFIQRSPTVSFTGTDALGLGQEEVLDLLSSRTKAQRKRGLLTPPQTHALAGLIEQILGLKPAGNTNVYKILHQVKSELKKGPAAVPPTPPLPAPRPAGPAPPVPHGVETKPAMATPPPPLPTPMEEEHVDHVDLMEDLFEELNSDTELKPLLDSGFSTSPGPAGQEPGRPSILSPTGGKNSLKNELHREISRKNSANKDYANPPTGVGNANLAVARGDVTSGLPPATSSNGAARALRNWADCPEDQGPGADDDFTVVRTKKRRRESANSPTAAAPSSNIGGARTSRRPQSSAGSVPRAQEVRTTRAHITEARARQASSSEDHCVYLEHGPELQPFHYLRALDRMFGGTAGVIQVSKVNGHQLLGLANRGLAERLINEGLEVEGTLLRAFPFRKRAERITVGNLPFFLEDSAIISALKPYGRVTSIAPKLMKAGPYTYNDGRREAFIVLREGMTTERLPTRLEIPIKGEAWPAYLSSGIKCSRCRGQGHRRANCPLLAGRTNAPGPATPTSPTSVPSATAPGLPQQPSAQPPPSASPSPTLELSDVPPASRAALLPPAAPRSPSPAPLALPVEDTSPAPPPVIPAPSLRAPGDRAATRRASSAFFASGECMDPCGTPSMIRAESPSKAEKKPVRLGFQAQPCADLSAKENIQKKISISSDEFQKYVNPPAGGQHANPAAPTNFDTASFSEAAAQANRSWADLAKDNNPEHEDNYTTVQRKKRRRGSAESPAAAAPSSNIRGAGAIRRPRSSTGWAPRAEEIRTTRAHIAEARARQASSTEDHCVYVERNPELEPFHYMRAIERMFGSTREVFQVTKMNGHFLVGLANRGMAERLVNEGLEVEGTLHRAFPFRKRAERITVGNLPFFVGDATVISALSAFGLVTSIAPKLMKAGPYIYNDGRREAFIILREGMTIEGLPTRLNITIKGEAWPAYLSSGIRCSRCRGQGHRRANCPLLAGRTNAPGPATPTSPTSVPSATAPGLPQQPSAQPPPSASPSPTMELSDVPPASRAALLLPAAPRPPPPAPLALPVEDTSPAPPPVIPAPSLRAPGGSVSPQSTKSGPPAQDIEMTASEESSASSTSSSRTSMRDDLVAFIRRSPTVSFAGTDALGLGREEVLDLLSSRTKAQRKRWLLTPPQTDALAGLIKQILGLKPAGNTNVYKILHQVKTELKKGPAAVPPTPPLPAPWPAEPAPPAPQERESTPAMAIPPPPPSAQMEADLIDRRCNELQLLAIHLMKELNLRPQLNSLYLDLVEAVLYPEDRKGFLGRLSPGDKKVIAQFLDRLSEHTQDLHSLTLRDLSELRAAL